LGITGKKGSAGVSAGKIYFINQNNFEALFEFSDISITKYVYHILNKKFSNNEQVEFYLGGDENTISQTILNRQSYQYYPLSYSNTNRNTHNMRNFALVDKTSYFIIDDISGETPDEDNENTNKSRIYLDQTYTSENSGKLKKYTKIITSATVNENLCNSCMACADVCPVSAISFDSGIAHINDTCMGCETCYNACAEHAIILETEKILEDF
jgi:ferredoxin